jgi:hypothetical protein
MMVLMAVVTTFMTSPALALIQRLKWKRMSLTVKSAPEGS